MPDFSQWEATTQLPIYLGQVEFVRRWVRGTVLDVASNYGRFSALNSGSTVSVDIERRFLKRGMELGYVRSPVISSALELPFKDKTFDTVMAMGIADHIPLHLFRGFIDEVVRVVSPSGRVLVQVTSPYSPYAIWRLRSYGDWIHPVSPFRIVSELKRRGLKLNDAISSGILGSLTISPRSVSAFVPWAVHVTIVASRPD
jgi:SAM-dependent methyltransferase